jgi:exoribonuclease-2
MAKVYRSAMGESASMYALYEEGGKFQTGRVLSEAEASAQIELDSGKRVKVKTAQLLMKFD